LKQRAHVATRNVTTKYSNIDIFRCLQGTELSACSHNII